MSKILQRINWPVTLFFIITPIVALIGTIFLIKEDMIRWPTLVLAVVFLFLGGLSITAGYHRLFSHRTYSTVWFVRLLYVLFGAGSFEGSVLDWCTDHRRHHRYVDTPKDPYNINQGFWYAHIGWLFVLDSSKRDYSNVEDLVADPMLAFQHKHFLKIASFMGFVVPMLIASLWGDPLGGLLIAGALRIVVNDHFTFAINSVCHYFGKRTYSDTSTARDNWVTALITYGEGFHNFHHQFPNDYRNGIRAYHYDPTKWLIYGLSSIGMARDLKVISEHRIIRYQLRTQEKLLLQKANTSETLLEHVNSLLLPVRERILQALNQWEQVEQDYLALKKRKVDKVKDKVNDYRTHLLDARLKLKQIKRELKASLAIWSDLLNGVNSAHKES